MGKIYNVVLNSVIGTGTYNNNLNYFIDWLAVLPKKPLKLTWTYTSGLNYNLGIDIPYLSLNFNGKNYIAQQSGAPSTQIIGCLRQMTANQTLFLGSYYAGITDNAPTYLDGPPTNNNFNVAIYSNTRSSYFFDGFYTPSGIGSLTQAGNVVTVTAVTQGQIYIGALMIYRGTGTLTQAGNTVTVTSMSAGTGIITVGTILTITGFAVATVTALGTGTGGTGTYTVNIAQTISSAVAFNTNYIYNPICGFGTGTGGTGTYYVYTSSTFTTAVSYTHSSANGLQPSAYVLTLSFEEVE